MSLLVIYGLIAFASVAASGSLILFLKVSRNVMRLLLAFSGAFLFAISLLHLVPELYATKVQNIGMWILAGFLIQLLLEFLSEGIEHGHVHADDGHTHDHDHVKFPFAIMMGLSIHSFLEGMPLGAQNSDASIFPPFLTGIVLHNIPIAIAFMSLMLHLGHSKGKAMIYLVIFSLMTPLGMLASQYIKEQLMEEMTSYFTVITAVVVGIFLHISTTILFESTENHRFNFIKFITILAGVAVAWLVVR